MQQVARLVDQVKDTKAGVLITGERKCNELIANKLHFQATGVTSPLLQLTALPCGKLCWRQSCSATKVPLRGGT